MKKTWKTCWMGSEFVFCAPHVQFWNRPARAFLFRIIYRKGSVVALCIVEFPPFSSYRYVAGHGIIEKFVQRLKAVLPNKARAPRHPQVQYSCSTVNRYGNDIYQLDSISPPISKMAQIDHIFQIHEDPNKAFLMIVVLLEFIEKVRSPLSREKLHRLLSAKCPSSPDLFQNHRYTNASAQVSLRK
jgi:hypothetical protein